MAFNACALDIFATGFTSLGSPIDEFMLTRSLFGSSSTVTSDPNTGRLLKFCRNLTVLVPVRGIVSVPQAPELARNCCGGRGRKKRQPLRWLALFRDSSAQQSPVSTCVNDAGPHIPKEGAAALSSRSFAIIGRALSSNECSENVFRPFDLAGRRELPPRPAVFFFLAVDFLLVGVSIELLKLFVELWVCRCHSNANSGI